jgi:Tfp pilus assembly protein PilX
MIASMTSPTVRPKPALARRGSAYLFVLAVALVVGMIGLGVVSVARIQVRQATDSRDELAARALASAAADQSLLAIDNTTNWRTVFKGQTISNSLNGGTLSWQLADANGGSLDASTANAVILTATGQRGLAKYVLAFTLTPSGGSGPFPTADRTLSFSTTTISSNGHLNLDAGTLASSQAVTNSGSISGNVQAPSISGSGSLSGTLSTAALVNTAPPQSVIDAYIAKATTITSTNKLQDTVLAPGYNSSGGGTNADGVYYMQRNGNIQISNLRVNGTLIIATNNKVTINGPILFEHYRTDYPALIIIGDLDMSYTGGAGALTENNEDNFNPPGAPYNGQTNSTKTDAFPADIRGMVAVTGNATIGGNSDIYGLLMTNGNTTINGTLNIHADADTQNTPPAGYFGQFTGVSPTGCARVVN